MRRRMGAVLATLAVAACGDTSPEQRLAALSQEREEAEAALEDAREAVVDQEALVEQTRTTLEVRREDLASAQESLAEIEKRMQSIASDPVVFRGVQRRLLEDSLFEGLAIRVEVDQGVVVLHGRVPDDATRDAAIQAARSFPGVVSVLSRLAVSAEPARTTLEPASGAGAP